MPVPASPMPSRSLILLICGPAGSGKTTLCDQLLIEFPNLHRIVTATTRPPRDGEIDGIDYIFLNHEAFQSKVEEGAFYEHATVHGRLYGTLKAEVERMIEEGRDVLLNIDVQGSASFREHAASDPSLAQRLVSVFILPSDLEVIRQRLRARGSDSEKEIERRLESARNELQACDLHDYILPTSTRDADYRLMSSIYLAEKHRVRLQS